MLKISKDTLSLKIPISKNIIRIEKIPPDRLKEKATKPMVTNEKSDFKKISKKAFFLVVKKREYIITVFERPSFTPGGKKGKEGSILSKTDNTIIRLRSNAVIVRFFVRFIIIHLLGNGICIIW